MCLPSATRPIVIGVGFDDQGVGLGKGTLVCLDAAADLARRTRAELEMVHAVQGAVSASGRALLVHTRHRLCASGVRARVTFYPGSRERALCAIALGCNAGLIVVGGSALAAQGLCRALGDQSAWPVLALCREEQGLVLLTDEETSTSRACSRVLGAATRLLPAG